MSTPQPTTPQPTTPTTQAAPAKPVPPPDALSRPYWDAAREGRLLLQRCGACGTPRHYPQILCGRCQSDAVDWFEAAPTGTVHSWTVAHHPYHPAFAAEVPYTLVIADMHAGVRMLGHYRGTVPIALGQPLGLVFEADAAGTPVPVFRPASA